MCVSISSPFFTCLRLSCTAACLLTVMPVASMRGLPRQGECQAGVCVCEKPWRGPECSSLALGPASRAGGYNIARTTSWGGSILRDSSSSHSSADGDVAGAGVTQATYWMWAAEMVDHCGLGAWTRNSRIVIASSDNATGPYTFRRQFAGVFSHEPAATRAPTGEYVVWFTTSAYGCNRSAFGESSTSCVSSKFCAEKNASDCPPPGGATCTSGCVDGAEMAAFDTISSSFTKTCSGQASKETLKKRSIFLQGAPPRAAGTTRRLSTRHPRCSQPS